MRVIGVDPGYDRLGVAVLEYDNGQEIVIGSYCIKTSSKDTLLARLQILGDEFSKILKQYQPDTLGIETIFFNTNQKTAIGVAEARGIVIYLAQAAGCKVYEFGPQEIKVAVTGFGKSDKSAVIEMTKRLAKGVPDKALDDEYDAIAVGITCLAHYGRTE